MAESIIYTPGGEFSSKSVLVEYFARTLDISNNPTMSDKYNKALVPVTKIRPTESDIIGNDWLVKSPNSIPASQSRSEYLRFRPTHIKDTVVKGI